MRLGYTAAQIRAAERPLLDRGVPLMARASAALAEHALGLIGAADGARAIVLAGAGDNGGDALFAAALLREAGVRVQIAPAMGPLHAGGAAAAFGSGVEMLGCAADGDPADPAAVVAAVPGAALIVDGVLGLGRGGTAAGGSPALCGPARELVRAVARAVADAGDDAPRVLAVDLPSGIDPDSGAIAEPDAVLRADRTVTFIGRKAGLVLSPGAEAAGEVVLEPIGAESALAGIPPTASLR